MGYLRVAGALILGAGLTWGLANPAVAQAQAAPAAALNVGDRAPVFTALDDNGETWNSADHVGTKYLVLYFYPAAMTSGCTDQACAFRDNRTQLDALGADVIGVSGDRVENLKLFKGQNRLNFTLLSDAEGSIARAFGVPTRAGGTVNQNVGGQAVALTRDLTTARWTFIIDRSGRIVYRDTEVNPAGDGDRVIAALTRLLRN